MINKIENRQTKEKVQLLEYLRQFPIVEVACKKCGVGRTTYYRWRKFDTEFAKQADEALEEGIKLINDMAESQLLSAIKEGNLHAIFYWLNHRHPVYTNKVEIMGRLTHDYTLTDDQEKLMTRALGMLQKHRK